MFLETLTKLMSERGMTRSTLAKASGVPYTTIDGFFKKGCDNVKLSTLQKIAKFFGVTLDYLIYGCDKSGDDKCSLTFRQKHIVELFDVLTEEQQDNIIGRAEMLAELNESDRALKENV